MSTLHPSQEPPKPFYKQRSFWFIFLYLLFIAIYTIVFILSDGKNVLLSSNELGDFLAGSFAPLAFLFLYLGYKQQGKELKQSNEVLRQQSEELAKSVVQQQKMFILAQEQFENEKQKFIKQIEPLFEFGKVNIFGNQYFQEQLRRERMVWSFEAEIKNCGGTASRINITSNDSLLCEGDYNFQHGQNPTVGKPSKESITLYIEEPHNDSYNYKEEYRIDFSINCIDIMKNEKIFNYYLIFKKQKEFSNPRGFIEKVFYADHQHPPSNHA